MTRVYVIGAEGQVARSLREAAARLPDIHLGFGQRPSVDLSKPPSLSDAIRSFKPDVVINPAAYTAVDKAEIEPEVAFSINRDGAEAAAQAAAEWGVPIVHLSTDYVFDGLKAEPYLETDTPNPQSVYGKSKLEGEIAVAKANPRHFIVRTSWVYAPWGNNFVRTMLKLANDRTELRIVNDQRGCPTYAPDLAEVLLSASVKLVNWRNEYAGVTHAAGPNAMTWYDFACHIFKQNAARGRSSSRVIPISTSEYPTRAARPRNSQLSTDRLESLLGVRLPPTQAALARCLDEIIANGRTS